MDKNSSRMNIPKSIIEISTDVYGRKTRNTHKVDNLLGEGSFGRVISTTIKIKFAWKNVLGEKFKEEEINIHKDLKHIHIVRFYKFYNEYDDQVWIKLEFCKTDLEKKGKLSEPELRYYISQIVEGLQYLHENLVIHRDLKPANIFIDKCNVIKIGDFGLAIKLNNKDERGKSVCGTPNYMAPEIVRRDKRGYSFEVDIWSLGVMMYKSLTGKYPFKFDNNNNNNKINFYSYVFPDYPLISNEAKYLISHLLETCPTKRASLKEIIAHPFFRFPVTSPKLRLQQYYKDDQTTTDCSSIYLTDYSSNGPYVDYDSYREAYTIITMALSNSLMDGHESSDDDNFDYSINNNNSDDDDTDSDASSCENSISSDSIESSVSLLSPQSITRLQRQLLLRQQELELLRRERSKESSSSIQYSMNTSQQQQQQQQRSRVEIQTTSCYSNPQQQQHSLNHQSIDQQYSSNTPKIIQQQQYSLPAPTIMQPQLPQQQQQQQQQHCWNPSSNMIQQQQQQQPYPSTHPPLIFQHHPQFPSQQLCNGNWPIMCQQQHQQQQQYYPMNAPLVANQGQQQVHHHYHYNTTIVINQNQYYPNTQLPITAQQQVQQQPQQLYYLVQQPQQQHF